MIAWAVIILLYNWLSAIYWTPGPDSSNLINTEKAVPIKPENSAYIKYKTPISLAFEDKNHLSNHMLIPDLFKFRVLYLLTSLFSDSIILFVEKLLIGWEQEVTFI